MTGVSEQNQRRLFQGSMSELDEIERQEAELKARKKEIYDALKEATGYQSKVIRRHRVEWANPKDTEEKLGDLETLSYWRSNPLRLHEGDKRDHGTTVAIAQPRDAREAFDPVTGEITEQSSPIGDTKSSLGDAGHCAGVSRAEMPADSIRNVARQGVTGGESAATGYQGRPAESPVNQVQPSGLDMRGNGVEASASADGSSAAPGARPSDGSAAPALREEMPAPIEAPSQDAEYQTAQPVPAPDSRISGEIDPAPITPEEGEHESCGAAEAALGAQFSAEDGDRRSEVTGQTGCTGDARPQEAIQVGRAGAPAVEVARLARLPSDTAEEPQGTRSFTPADPYPAPAMPEVMSGEPSPAELQIARKLGVKAFDEDIKMETIPVPDFRHPMIVTHWKAGLKQAHYDHVEGGGKYWGNKNHRDYIETIDGEPIEPVSAPVSAPNAPAAAPVAPPPVEPAPSRMLRSTAPQPEIIMPARKTLTPGEPVPKQRKAMSKAELAEDVKRKNAARLALIAERKAAKPPRAKKNPKPTETTHA